MHSRRDFLRLAGLGGAAVAGAGLLSACGGGSGGSGRGRAMQLGWIKNAQFAGEYFALEKGYYGDLGVTLVAGGAAGTSAEAALDTGKAWVGTSTPQNAAPAIRKGVPVVIVGAVLATSPMCIVSPAAEPLDAPKDLVGKKVGVADHNVPVVTALLKANGVDPGSVTIVPVQFDPTPLASGQVDAWSGFITNEPVSLRMKGFETHSFMYADHGLRMCAQTFVVARDTLKKERDAVKAYLTAEIKGWKDALADPAGGARLAVAKYGADQHLDQAQQTALLKATVPLVATAETKRNGLFTLSDALMNDTVAALRRSGTDIGVEELFDPSPLREIYAADAALKS
ncbi:ABC transporter substrate-binding protein [Actinomadura atramentaria]|uniref:ABC transporter substrate-binding protein n=1 Tax=Actinomadura atramentaria TaxID=1990 RepID=UPI00036507F5|nr:ABC transporter substrate-binding protein [Actinomadura atramentaria]